MDIPVTLPGMEGQNLALRTAGAFAGPKLLVNGQPVVKQNGTYNLRSNMGSTMAVKLKARLLDPIPNLVVGGQMVQIAPALAWYQYLWMSIPILLVFSHWRPLRRCCSLHERTHIPKRPERNDQVCSDRRDFSECFRRLLRIGEHVARSSSQVSCRRGTTIFPDAILSLAPACHPSGLSLYNSPHET